MVGIDFLQQKLSDLTSKATPISVKLIHGISNFDASHKDYNGCGVGTDSMGTATRLLRFSPAEPQLGRPRVLGRCPEYGGNSSKALDEGVTCRLAIFTTCAGNRMV
jgi:hypothetical protein